MWTELARDMSTEVHLGFCEKRRSESNPLLIVVNQFLNMIATFIGLFRCNRLLRNLQIILSCICELCENRHREGHTFLMDVN